MCLPVTVILLIVKYMTDDEIFFKEMTSLNYPADSIEHPISTTGFFQCQKKGKLVLNRRNFDRDCYNRHMARYCT